MKGLFSVRVFRLLKEKLSKSHKCFPSHKDLSELLKEDEEKIYNSITRLIIDVDKGLLSEDYTIEELVFFYLMLRGFENGHEPDSALEEEITRNEYLRAFHPDKFKKRGRIFTSIDFEPGLIELRTRIENPSAPAAGQCSCHEATDEERIDHHEEYIIALNKEGTPPRKPSEADKQKWRRAMLQGEKTNTNDKTVPRIKRCTTGKNPLCLFNEVDETGTNKSVTDSSIKPRVDIKSPKTVMDVNTLCKVANTKTEHNGASGNDSDGNACNFQDDSYSDDCYSSDDETAFFGGPLSPQR